MMSRRSSAEADEENDVIPVVIPDLIRNPALRDGKQKNPR